MSVLQRVRVISNERLDIPDFRNLSNFNCADWGAYFNKFMADIPYVVTGFDITSPRSLIGTTATEITVNIANSAMFHPASTGVEAAFFVATPSAATQTVALSPGSTNFIEMEYSLSTGAPDTRKFWDPSADGGAGEEFSQIIDTVENLDVSVSVNTIGFTEGKVPIAQIVVNSLVPASIVSITDSRPLFFRLGTGGSNPDPLHDFIFPDDPTGYARVDSPVTIDATSPIDANPFKGSDKGIRHFKDWANAVMTRIKELGGTAYWFAPGSGIISGVSLSELWWDTAGSKLTGNGTFTHSGGAATGSLTFGNTTILDGETFTLDDGINTATIFEFDNDGSVGGGNVAVTIGAGSVTILNTLQEFRDAAIAAINSVGAGLAITASVGGDAIVQLLNDNPGAVGNVAISETVADGGFTVSGMLNGGNVGLLTWTTDVFIRSMIGNYYFKIAADSVTLNDDEVAYIEQIRNVDLPSSGTLDWTNLAEYVDGSAGSFTGLAIGDFIKKESDGIERYVRIVDFKDAANGGGGSTTAAAALSVTLEVTLCATNGVGTISPGDTVTDTIDGGTATVVSVEKDVFTDSDDVRVIVDSISGVFGNGNALTFTSGGIADFDQFIGLYEGISGSEKAHYAKSEYTVSVAKRDDVPNSANTWWFAARIDNGGSTSKIWVRSGEELVEGATFPISGSPTNETLSYIGSSGQDDATPDYSTDATDAISGSSNYNAPNGEDLTTRISKLTSMMADKAQDKLIRLREGGLITWLVTGPPANTLSWSATFIFQIPSSDNNNTLASGSVVLTANQAAYVTIDRNASSALSLTVVDEDAVPQGENILVFAHRGSDNRIYMYDGTSLGDTDVVQLGGVASSAGVAGLRNFVLEATDNLGLTSNGSNNPRDLPFSDLRFLHGVERVFFDDMRSIEDQNTGIDLTGITPGDIGTMPVFHPIFRGEQKVWEDRVILSGAHWTVRQQSDGGDNGHRVVYNGDDAAGDDNEDQYVEITFYGTGLSLLMIPDSSTLQAQLESIVDGSSAGTFTPSTGTLASGVDRGNARMYYKNIEVPGAKNLTQGIHTVRLVIQSGANENIFRLCGFDIYNSSPVRLPGRAIINSEIVEFNTTESLTLPTGGNKGVRARLYLDTSTQLFAWATNADNEEIQTGTIDFNGASPDRITGLSDPSQFFDVSTGFGNIVLITDDTTGAQMLTIPTAINAGNLEFANGAFTGENQGINYGDDLTDTNDCTVELWGNSLSFGDFDKDTLFRGDFQSWNDTRLGSNNSMSDMDDAIAGPFHDDMWDNHTSIGAQSVRFGTGSGVFVTQPVLVLDDNSNGPDNAMKITFLGSGFVLGLRSASLTDTLDIYVDGIQITSTILGSGLGAAGTRLTSRSIENVLVSDLPFGWHTIQIHNDTSPASESAAMTSFRILGPREPIVSVNDITIAETFILPTAETDLGLDDEIIETDRAWWVTANKGGIGHKVFHESLVENTGWTATHGINDREEPSERYETETSGNRISFVFYGTGIGIRAQSGTATFPTVSIDIDGGNVFSGAIFTTMNYKRELFFGSLTEGQHLVEIEYTGGTGDLDIEGWTTYGRRTIRPYKHMVYSNRNRSIQGNSSWIDLRPLTPSERIYPKNWLPINTCVYGAQLITSTENQTVFPGGGSSERRRSGPAWSFYSETGYVDIDFDFRLRYLEIGSATNTELTIYWYLDNVQLRKHLAGTSDTQEYKHDTLAWFPGDSIDHSIAGSHASVYVGKGWHTLTCGAEATTDPDGFFEISSGMVTIKDVE